jgi:hypothetical protein
VSAMLTEARALAVAGWEVFPCRRDKSPITRHGYKEATTDLAIIAGWWRLWPDASIGASVPASSLVIDIDPRRSGDLAKLIELVGPLPATLTVWSGRNDGGRHLYFRRPSDLVTASTRLPQGIDLKDGGKGYCIMPPSIHPATGEPYRWEIHEPAIMPYRLQELLRFLPAVRRTMTANGARNGAGLIRKVAETPEGDRHDVLVWAAGCAIKDGILDQIEKDLVAASVSTGYPEKSALDTIASMRRSVR